MKEKLFKMLLLSFLSTLLFQSCRTDDGILEQAQVEKSQFAIFGKTNSSQYRTNGNTNYQNAFKVLYYKYFEAHPEVAPNFYDTSIMQIDFRFASQEIQEEDGSTNVFYPVVLNGTVVEVMMATVNKDFSEIGYDILEKNEDIEQVITTFAGALNDNGTPYSGPTFANVVNSNGPTYSGADSNIEIVYIPPPKKVVKLVKAIVPLELPPTGPCAVYQDCPIGGGGTPAGPTAEDPCSKITDLQNDPQFMQNVSAIDKDSIFNLTREMGYAAYYQNGGSGANYTTMSNHDDTSTLTPPSGSLFIGFIHTHNNFDKEGKHSVKMFSPGDLDIFLDKCASNAHALGKLANAYAMVITSQGNYMLKFNGAASWQNPGPGTMTWWDTWYKKDMAEIQNVNGSYDQNKVEEVFLNFLKNRVKIEGLCYPPKLGQRFKI